MKILKTLALLKKVLGIVLAAYLIIIVGFFSYAALEVGLLPAGLVTDRLLVRGLITRLLEPVSKDELLIGRFNQQRPVLQKLLDIHNEKCFREEDSVTFAMREYPEVVSLREKINLISVREEPELWFSNPYSEEAAKKAVDAFSAKARAIEGAPLALGQGEDRPHRVGVQHKLEELRWKECRYQAATFVSELFPEHGLSRGWRYFPVEPEARDGQIYLPNRFEWQRPLKGGRIFLNLDFLSRQFLPIRECAYRKIETQWYLFTCPSR